MKETIRLASSNELEQWDTLLAENPGGESFFQQSTFITFKSKQAISPWEPRYIVHTLASGRKVYASYLVKHIALCGTYWYAPSGPRVAEIAQCNEIIQQIKAFDKTCFSIVIEPPVFVVSKNEGNALRANIPNARKITAVQPNVHTVMVDLTVGVEERMQQLKQRTRRALRQAEKESVRVENVSPSRENLDLFFAMYKETSERAGFYIRTEDYYREFWKTYIDKNQLSLFFAYNKEDRLIAAIIVLHTSSIALYKDGASIRGGELTKGTLHYLQWSVMQWLEEAGVKQYDLHGTPPSWQLDDPAHRQHGLGVFKTSFGEVTDTLGGVQITVKPLQQKLWDYFLKKLYFTYSSKKGGYFY